MQQLPHSMEPGYRQLDQREREILLKLLERNFEGKDAFLTQIDSALGQDRIPGEFLSLRCTDGQPEPKGSYPISEASCQDLDGAPVSVILHTKQGFIAILETGRLDGEPIKRLPQASDLTVF